MSYTAKHQLSLFPNPVLGQTPDIVILNTRGQDNAIATIYNAHDADGTIHLGSGGALLHTLTLGTGLSGTSFDGSANVTAAVTGAPASGLTGTTLASGVVHSSLTDLGVLTALNITAGDAVTKVGTAHTGTIAQVSGINAGFDLFTPVANLTYHLLVAGKDAADGTGPSNAFLDEIVFNATAGYTVTTWHSGNVLGTPGARTYTNNAGKLHIAIANGSTWYIDMMSIRFAS